MIRSCIENVFNVNESLVDAYFPFKALYCGYVRFGRQWDGKRFFHINNAWSHNSIFSCQLFHRIYPRKCLFSMVSFFSENTNISLEIKYSTFCQTNLEPFFHCLYFFLLLSFIFLLLTSFLFAHPVSYLRKRFLSMKDIAIAFSMATCIFYGNLVFLSTIECVECWQPVSQLQRLSFSYHGLLLDRCCYINAVYNAL